MNEAQQLNCDLARALGIKDVREIGRVVLTIEPGELPRIEVSRHINSADGLQTAVEMLKLQPQEGGAIKVEQAEPAVVLLGDVQRLKLEPGDIVVLKTVQPLSNETAGRLRDYVSARTGHAALVLGDGIDIGVLAAASGAGVATTVTVKQRFSDDEIAKAFSVPLERVNELLTPQAK